MSEEIDAGAAGTFSGQELDLAAVKKRTVTGVVLLFLRNHLNTVITFAGVTLLAAVLGPSEFGVFVIVSAVVDIFGYFSDVGLAAALVQKKETPSLEEFRSSFTLQQLLVTGSVTLIFLFGKYIGQWNRLQEPQMVLLYAVAVSFWLVSLKSIPSVMLERKLEFQKIVLVALVETIVFYSLAVLLAYRHFGLNSYTVAVLGRSFVGVVLMYAISPWPIGLSFKFQGLKGLFKFGVPYQVNTLIALVKDRLTIVFLGGIVGAAGIGFAGWAEKYANLVLRNFMDPVNTVTFPAYSRIQNDRIELGKMISKSLFFITGLVFPTVVTMAILAPWVLTLIPVYRKWEPALLALDFYVVNTMWASASTHLTNVLNSIGRIKWNTYLMIFWTVLTWTTIPFLAYKFGFTGMAMGTAIIGCTSFIPMILVRREVPYSLGGVYKTLFASVFLGVVLLGGRMVLTPTWIALAALGFVGVVAYLSSVYFLTSGAILGEAKSLLLSVKKHEADKR